MSSLSAATQDRKARLAQLKSLKRKQPTDDDEAAPSASADLPSPPKSPKLDTSTYVSGRNYDPETRGPRLGFEISPAANATTLEARAQALSTATAAEAQAAEAEAENKPIDLFKLQPKKPNWDLKRDLDRKLEVLNVRTDNAIARLVRDRIKEQQDRARGKKDNDGLGVEDGEGVVGIEGTTLVEATKEREREDEEDARREKEAEEAYLDGG